MVRRTMAATAPNAPTGGRPRPRRARTPLAVALALAAATAATPGQEVVIPVDDLLYDHAARAPYLEIVRSYELVGARRFEGEGYLGGLHDDFNDGQPLRDRGGRGQFTREQLGEVLRALGLAAEPKLLGRSLVVPGAEAEDTRRLLDELRAALPPSLTIEVRLTETRGGETRVRLARTAECEPGRLQVISEVSRRLAVLDYNVEIAQAAMMSNPLALEVRAGVMVAIRPQLAPSGEWAVLETVARIVGGNVSSLIDTGHPGVGPIDRVPMNISETARVVLARPGSRTVQRWSDGETSYELTLRTQWQLPKPVRPGGHDFGVFSVRGDLSGFRSVAVDQRDNDERGFEREREEPWDDISELAGAEARWLEGPDRDEAPEGQHYVAVDASTWAIGAAVMGWFESRTAGPEIEVRCYDVPAGADWQGDGKPPAGARPVGGTRLSQVEASWSATAVREERTIVHDWDCEVANSARIPDPKCMRVSTGLAINVRRLGDTFEVEGEISRTTAAGKKTLKLSAPVLSPEVEALSTVGMGNTARAQKYESPPKIMIADTVHVEQPTIAAVPFRFTQRLAADQQPAVYRSTASGLLEEGRELLIVVSRLP